MTRKLLVATVALVAISFGLAACFVEYDPDDVPQGVVMGTHSGTAIGRDQGYHGNPITVTLTLNNGLITEVIITGPMETPAVGGVLIKSAPATIKNANSLDAISGATAEFTRDGIIRAGKKALFEITNGEYGSEDGK
jgi:fumarate reductase flavoprotein subunit